MVYLLKMVDLSMAMLNNQMVTKWMVDDGFMMLGKSNHLEKY